MNEVVPLDNEQCIALLRPRLLDSHKGDHGHVAVIGGGQSGYSGAVCLAGEAALRVGAGLVSAVVAPESLPLLARAPKELMCYGLKKPKHILNLLKKNSVMVLGPGLSQNNWGRAFFCALLKIPQFKVIDADALNWLAQSPQKQSNWVLTPHPGEASRLLNQPVATIQQNRLHTIKELQRKYGGIIVLKGMDTLIADDQGNIFCNVGALPVLATAGTGDVLAGLIGGLLAQGYSGILAAKIGVSIHTQAAKLEQEKGSRGMLASDLFLHIRRCVNVI